MFLSRFQQLRAFSSVITSSSPSTSHVSPRIISCVAPFFSRFSSASFSTSSSPSSSSTTRLSSNASKYPWEMHGTTILCVRKKNTVVMIGDGQVTMGQSEVVKPNAKKVRRVGKDVLVGFAGATADAMTLLERLEGKLEEYPGQTMRACVELSKNWRTDKYLRKLEALMIVSDPKVSLMLSGDGNVLETEDGIISIGSGGTYALAAARALMGLEDVTAEEVARRSMEIAADICVFTNKNFTVETLQIGEEEKK